MNLLKIYTLTTLADGTESRVPFPNEAEQAMLGTFEYSASRMGGAPSISAKFFHRLCLDDFWNEKQFVEFQGEKFFVRDTPSSSKDNDDARFEHEVTFLHERAVLENVYMIDSVFKGEEGQQPATDKYVSNSTKVVFFGNVTEFVARFNACLFRAGLGGKEELNGYLVVVDDGIQSEEKLVSFEDKFFSEALQEIYNIFKLPYYWDGKVCHIGYGKDELFDAVFSYGADNELLSIEKQNANNGYCNRATGTGSSDNLPYYYPNTSTPDATMPHAVKGNTGITDDSQLSVIDKALFANAKPELESVNLIGEETEGMWSGKALRYIEGMGHDAATVVKDDIWREYYSYDYDGDGRVDVVFVSGFRGTSISKLQYKIPSDTTVWMLGSNFSAERSLEIWEQIQEDVRRGWETPELARFHWAEWNDGRSYETLGTYIYVKLRVDRKQVATRVNLRCKLSYEGDALGLRINDFAVVADKSKTASIYGSHNPSNGSVGDVLYVCPANLTPPYEEIDEEGYLNSSYDIYGLNNLDSDEVWLRIAYQRLNPPTDFAYAPEIPYADTPYPRNHKWLWLNFDTPVIGDVKARWYREGVSSVEQWTYHHNLDHWGLASSVEPVNGDRIVRLYTSDIIKDATPVTGILMPTVYRDTKGAETFYNASNAPKDYKRFFVDEDGENYVFEHEFSKENPREGKFDFPEIMPSIKGMTNANGTPLDRFLEVVFDKTDSDNLKDDIFTPVVNDEGETLPSTQSKESSEYAHPFFYVKLPKTNTEGGHKFNLFACAVADGSEMTISMTSGQCGGCNFTIMVDEDTKKNPVLICLESRYATDGTLICAKGDILRDDDGNVVLVGSSKAAALGYNGFQDFQQDTSLNEVWVCLRKETDTYGIIMPNATSRFRPSAEDTFVILNINLPLAYVTDAEDRLSKAIVKAMWENNFEKFNFSIKLSRIFCEQNRRTASLINENAILYVKYNGVVLPLYVNSYSYKVDDNILPEIGVELSGDIALGTNFSQNRQTEQGVSVSQVITGGVLPIVKDNSETEPSDDNVYSAKRSDKQYISKRQNDGTPFDFNARNIDVEENITGLFAETEKGYKTKKFERGVVGARRGVYYDDEGNMYVKNLFVEESMTVPSITYSRAMVMFGIFVVAPAAGKILEVEPDMDANGNFLKTGWVTLDLEDGEHGSVALGDMLLGFWHNLSSNSEEDRDGTWDEKRQTFVRDGNYKMRGFNSIYFLVTALDATISDNSRFRYQLRGATDPSWTDMQHPAKGMSFFGFGNTINTNRQSIYIITREYDVRLVKKNTWTYDHNNVIEIHGKLEGFSMLGADKDGNPYVKWFHGDGQVFGNGYFFGTIEQFDRIQALLVVNVDKPIVSVALSNWFEPDEDSDNVEFSFTAHLDSPLGTEVITGYSLTYLGSNADMTYIAKYVDSENKYVKFYVTLKGYLPQAAVGASVDGSFIQVSLVSANGEGNGSVTIAENRQGEDGKDGKDGEKGERGNDGTGIEIKGGAIKYYDAYFDYYSEENKRSGIYLVFGRIVYRPNGVPGSSPGAYLYVYNSDDDTTEIESPEIGDCYVNEENGHLYTACSKGGLSLANNTYWQDGGEIKGKDAVFYSLNCPKLILEGSEGFNIEVVKTEGENTYPISYEKAVNEGIHIEGAYVDWNSNDQQLYISDGAKKGETYEIKLKRNGYVIADYTVVCVGDGDKGYEGVSIVRGEWEEGVEYRNDTDGTVADDGVRYMHEVSITDVASGRASWYLCKKIHKSSESDNKPNVGEYWSEYWTKLNDLAPTRISYADIYQAFIQFLQVAQLTISNEDGIYGAFGGGKDNPYPLWFGGDSWKNAVEKHDRNGNVWLGKNFSVVDGVVTAKDMQAQGGDFKNVHIQGNVSASMFFGEEIEMRSVELPEHGVFDFALHPATIYHTRHAVDRVIRLGRAVSYKGLEVTLVFDYGTRSSDNTINCFALYPFDINNSEPILFLSNETSVSDIYGQPLWLYSLSGIGLVKLMSVSYNNSQTWMITGVTGTMSGIDKNGDSYRLKADGYTKI